MGSPLRLFAALFLGMGVAGVAASPPEFLRWRSYEEPVFPPELHGTAVREGFATVVFTFDDDGRITDRLVIATTHPAFNQSVLTAMRRWRVDTAGLSSGLRRESVRFDFSRSGSVVSLSQRDASKASFSAYGDHSATPLLTFREAAIDGPLRIVAHVPAIYPDKHKAAGREGHATIDFILDGEGRVRVPAIAEATQPEFGVAALAALRQSRFAPGRRTGLIVQVIASRTVTFRLAPSDK
jgi:TonB family protein